MEVISREYVEKELKRYNTPGMGIGVIKDGEVLLNTGFGYKNLEKKTEIDGNTVWGIASCSKSFTSTLIGKLVDEGILDFDRPIKEYLPDFQMYDETATRECTLRDMMCHRTGMHSYDAVWSDPTAEDREDLWKRLRYLKPNRPFRISAQYNNLMFDMAAHVAEKVTGRTWDELIKEKIFEPLGMKNSSTSIEDLRHHPDAITPYWPGKDGPFPVEPWNVDVGAPAGGINSTINDMLKYLQFHIDNGSINGEQYISSEIMRDLHMQNMRYTLWPWHFEETAPIGGYAMGWYNDVYRGNPMYWHLGEIEGSGTMQVVLPRKKIGIIVYNNLHAPDILIQCSVVYTIIDNLLGLDPIDWSEKMWSVRHIKGNMHSSWEFDFLGDSQVKGTSPSHQLSAYTGEYEDPGHGRLTVCEEEGQLVCRFRGFKHELEHYHYDVFRAEKIKMDTVVVTTSIAFHTNPLDGSIDGLEFMLYDDIPAVFFRKIAEK